MRNSTILFLAAFVIAVWFGAEVFTAQELCATTCVSLSGLNVWEDGIIVAILPVLLVIGGVRLLKQERLAPPAKTGL
ncbi:MAG: hypothetical protein ACREBS_06175 [Nitrososphaerales archaeon]